MKKAVFFSLVFFAFVSASYSQVGTIKDLTGDVELKPAGAQVFSPAVKGGEVAQDTVVSTGFRSSAIITVGSNEINVRPLTRLSLSEISSSGDTENLNVNLQAGRVRVDVKPPVGVRANTRVQGPSATASVRGTSFEMDTKNLNVNEGSVSFGGSNGTAILVAAGSSSEVTAGGGTADPVQVAAAALIPSAPVGVAESASPVFIPTAAPPSAAEGSFNLELKW